MQTRLIRSDEELFSLRDAWNALLESNPEIDFPFYSWEWFSNSWKFFGTPQGSELFLYLVEEGDQLLGIFPLIRTIGTRRFLRIRSLEFCNPGIIPRNTFLVDGAVAVEPVCRTLWDRLIADKEHWDMITLSDIPAMSPFHDYCLNTLAERNISLIKTRGRQSPFIRLDGWSYDEYFAKKGDKDARRRWKRTMEKAQVEDQFWGIKIFQEEADIQLGWNLSMEVRKESWKGPFKNPKYVEFYTNLCTELAVKKEVVIPILFYGETPIAAQFITGKNGVYFLHTNDFDMRFHGISPGKCLIYQLFIHAFEQHWRVFDFTGGDYDYKKELATDLHSHSAFQFFHRGWKSRLIFESKVSFLPFLRKILKKPRQDDFPSVIRGF